MCGSSDAAQATVSEDVLGQLFNETVTPSPHLEIAVTSKATRAARPQNAGAYCAVSNELYCLEGCVEKEKKNSTTIQRGQFSFLWLERNRSHDFVAYVRHGLPARPFAHVCIVGSSVIESLGNFGGLSRNFKHSSLCRVGISATGPLFGSSPSLTFFRSHGLDINRDLHRISQA